MKKGVSPLWLAICSTRCMTVSAPPPSSSIVLLASGKPSGATPQSGWRPSDLDTGKAVPSSAVRPQPRSKQKSASHTSNQDVVAGPIAALVPAPQLESDFPAAAFSAVLSGFSQAQPPVAVSTKSSQRLAGAPLTQLSPSASAAFVASASAVVPAALAAPPGAFVAPGTPVRADSISPQTTGPKTTSPKITARVPVPGLNGMKPLPPCAAAPIAEPRQHEPPSLHPSAIEPPATPNLGAGINAVTDRARAGDVPAPESESGKSPSGGFQRAVPPALEAPASAAVTSPAAAAPHPLAFAARLVERPATGIAEDDNPAQDPRAQTQTNAEAADLPETALPVLSGAATQNAPRTALPLLPQDPMEPAPPAAQAMKPEDPHPSNTSTEVSESVPRREDTDNPPQPKVVRPDSAGNLQTAIPHVEAPAGGAPVAGFERLDGPMAGRAASSAAAEQGKAIDSAQTTAQVLGGSAAREAPAASPAQNISVRLSTDGQPALEVRIMDRGGEVRVAVHSPDPATSESVRAGLPELVDRLGQHGYETEIWRPPAAPSSASARGESDGSFSRGGNRNPEEQQHPQRQPRPEWLEELDSNLNPNTNRSAIPWRP